MGVGTKAGRKQGGPPSGLHPEPMRHDGRCSPRVISSVFAQIFFSFLAQGEQPPLLSSPFPCSVCVCVYFSVKLPVLPEEREVGVLIYGSAAEAAVRGAVWEGCNTTSFY